MTIAFNVAAKQSAKVDVFDLPICSDRFGDAATEIDWDFLTAEGFEGKIGQTKVLPAVGGVALIVVGVGPSAAVTPESLRIAAASVARAVGKRQHLSTHLLSALPTHASAATVGRGAQAIVEGVALASYVYNDQKSTPLPSRLTKCTIAPSADASPADVKKLTTSVKRGAAIADAVAFARDLVNGPPSQMTAPVMAKAVADKATKLGLTVKVLDLRAIKAAGFPGLVAVNRGSLVEPRYVELSYGNPKAAKKIHLVGKGVTFDTGGLNLKPYEGMLTMKCDMGGAAAVAGAMMALASVKPNAHVVAHLMLTDNQIGPNATMPSDIIKYANGTTVEVLNTDAEGRLILADGLCLAAKAKPDAIVNVATLTGAVTIALGDFVAGLFSNNDSVAAQISAGSQHAGEAFWRLPLVERYRRLLDSKVADMCNISAPGGGGANTAALFLERFVNGVPWAHLDIAGPAFIKADDADSTTGGTGFATRTLVEFIDNFEKSAA